MDFPTRLRELRTSRKWTQEQLGQKVNVTKVSISGYESGNRTPDIETLQKLADVFEVSVDYLLGRQDIPAKTNNTSLDDMEMHEGENLFFFDLEGLSEEDIEKVKEHIEFLRYQAKKHHEREQQKKQK